MNLQFYVHVFTIITFSLLTPTATPMDERSLGGPADAGSLTRVTFTDEQEALWQRLIALSTADPAYYDQQYAQQAIDTIIQKRAAAYRIDPHTNLSPAELCTLALFHDYCHHNPSITHPLTHLISYNAAQTLYKARNSHRIEDTIHRIKSAGSPYAALAMMYYYFSLCRGERVAYEQAMSKHISLDTVATFFANKPRWGLVPTVPTTVSELPIWIKDPNAIFGRLIALTDDDYPLIIRHANETINQKNTIYHRPNLTEEQKMRAYENLEGLLLDHSTTTLQWFIKLNQLDPDHIFPKARTTPLLIAIMRGSPSLVVSLLANGSLPDLRVERAHGASILPLEFARSLCESITTANAPTHYSANSWRIKLDRQTEHAQKRIIKILARHTSEQLEALSAEITPEPQETPGVEITPAENPREVVATGVIHQDSRYLQVSTQPLEIMQLRRQNALPEEAHEQPEVLMGPTHIVDGSGWSCGCGATGNTKPKTCAIM